jgi:hypothetical protein
MKKNWTRFPGPNGGGCGAQWRHVSGHVVQHCGHPTANFPYYITAPDGSIVWPYGRDRPYTFAHLADAKGHVESLPCTSTTAKPS